MHEYLIEVKKAQPCYNYSMSTQFNKHIPIIIGIGLPVLFIIGLVISVAVQSSQIQPHYSFIYSIKLENPVPIKAPPTTTPEFIYKYYTYNVIDNTSHIISSDQLKSYKLDPGPSSPDGYVVRFEYTNSGIFELFGSGGKSRNGWYI